MTQLEKSVFGAGFVAMTEDELYEVNGGGLGRNPPDITDPMPTEGYEFEFRNGIRLRIM